MAKYFSERNRQLSSRDKHLVDILRSTQEMTSALAAIFFLVMVWQYSQSLPLHQEYRRQQQAFERSFGISFPMTEEQINELISLGVLDTGAFAAPVSQNTLATIVPAVQDAYQEFSDATNVDREFAPFEKQYFQFSIDSFKTILKMYEEGNLQEAAKELYLYPLVMETLRDQITQDALQSIHDQIAKSENTFGLEFRYFFILVLLSILLRDARQEMLS